MKSPTKSHMPEKRKMSRNKNAARGPARVIKETSKRISPKSRVPATVNVKGGKKNSSKTSTVAEKRVLGTAKKVKAAIDRKGGGLKKPKATRPLKVNHQIGKSSIKRKKASSIPKIGPSTMEMISLTEGRNSYKGLKKSKPVKAPKAIRRS